MTIWKVVAGEWDKPLEVRVLSRFRLGSFYLRKEGEFRVDSDPPIKIGRLRKID